MSAIAPVSAGEFDRRVHGAAGAVVLEFYQASCAPWRRLEPRLEQIAQQYAGASSSTVWTLIATRPPT